MPDYVPRLRQYLGMRFCCPVSSTRIFTIHRSRSLAPTVHSCLEWLNKYTFPTEAKFNDRGMHAQRIADFFISRIAAQRHHSCIGILHIGAGIQWMRYSRRRKRSNMLILAGKMMMDSHAPANILDTAQTSYDDSKALNSIAGTSEDAASIQSRRALP